MSHNLYIFKILYIMSKTNNNSKGYNEKNPRQPEGSIQPDNDDKKTGSAPHTSKNEKLSIPERKLRNDKK
jgi:hypothetical protein